MAWIALYLLTSLSFYTHLLAALALPVQALWLLRLPRERFGARLRNAAIYFLALALPYVPFLRWVPGMWTSSFQTGHPFVPLDDIVQVLAGAFSRGVLGIQPISLLPYMTALVAGLIVWPRSKRGAAQRTARSRRAVAWPSYLPLGWCCRRCSSTSCRSGCRFSPTAISSGRCPHFWPCWLAASRGCSPSGGHWASRIAAAIIALNGWSVYLQATQPIKADFRAAATYVLARWQPGDTLMYQIPYNRYTFTYYASPAHDPEDPAWQGVEGPYTNAGMGEAEADAWMATRIGGAERVWLISSEAPMWDERNLTGRWLDANATAADRAEFARVTVERYER